MKLKNWNFLVYIHSILLLWIISFVASLSLGDGGKTAGTLAIGNALFLFVNIPLSIFSLVLCKKDRFSKCYKTPAVGLSVVNMLVSIAFWIFVLLLMQKP